MFKTRGLRSLAIVAECADLAIRVGLPGDLGYGRQDSADSGRRDGLVGDRAVGQAKMALFARHLAVDGDGDIVARRSRAAAEGGNAHRCDSHYLAGDHYDH